MKDTDGTVPASAEIYRELVFGLCASGRRKPSSRERQLAALALMLCAEVDERDKWLRGEFGVDVYVWKCREVADALRCAAADIGDVWHRCGGKAC